MEFKILGPLEVRDGRGHTVRLHGSRRRALLAILLLHANEPVSPARLIDDLWSDGRPATAANALQVHVSHLRRLVGREALVTEAGCYRLRADLDRIDARRFEHLLAEGRADLAVGSHEAASAKLRQALALWRGPALADFRDRPFAAAEAARLDELRLAAIEDRFQADLLLGRHDQIVPEIEARVSECPTSERLRAQLMLALYRSGRQADALEEFQRLRRTLLNELGLEPGRKLRALQQAILLQDPALDPRPADGEAADTPARRADRGRVAHQLPVPPTPLLGREAELKSVVELLQRDAVRLVTLTGPGGCGKTRLALEAAAQLLPANGGRVYFVDLASVASPDLVAPAVAQAVELREPGGGPSLPDLLAETFGTKRVLLVLDNFEHLLKARALVADLLRHAGSLTVLATSRARLGIRAEHDFAVPPLALEASTALFADRAQAIDSSFALTDANAGQVEEICRKLDGLPLAIELAAARMNVLTPAQLSERLDLELSYSAPQDLPARHRSLRAAIDWSHELLDERERTLFARLAVFAGTWLLDDAEALNNDLDGVVETLGSLVDKSLVRREDGDGAVARFRLLQTVREYALERLATLPEAEEIRLRHTEHFLRLAEEAEKKVRRDVAWLRRLDLAQANLDEALRWTRDSGADDLALRLASALSHFWRIRGYTTEGRKWLEEALEQATDAPPRVRVGALRGALALADRQKDFEKARAYGEEWLGLSRELGDDELTASALNSLGVVATNTGDYALAASLYEESIALRRRSGEVWGLAATTTNLGDLALNTGNYERAGACFDEALELFRGAGHQEGIMISLVNVGMVAIERQRYDVALERLAEAGQIAEELDFSDEVATCLVGIAAALAFAGDAVRAAELLAASERLLESTGDSLSRFEMHMSERAAEAARSELGELAYAAARERGRELPLERGAIRRLTTVG